MKSTEMENIDELLSSIQQVDAPNFLYTRIEQNIQNTKESTLSLTKVGWVSFALIMLITINVIGISNYMNNESPSTDLLNQLNLQSDYNLYQ